MVLKEGQFMDVYLTLKLQIYNYINLEVHNFHSI